MSNDTSIEVMQGLTLPTIDMVGTSNDTEFNIPISDSNNEAGMVLSFMGDFIALASTFRPTHYRHPNDLFMPSGKGLKCNRCRWFELRIFYSHSSSQYVLHFAGRSIVPGEVQRFRYETAVTAYEVIEILSAKTAHGAPSLNGQPQVPYLTAPALRALSQAAGFDDDIRDAFTARRRQL